ncbi:hypothetical protein WKC52_12780 [Morganella morganii]|uniref:hypothetical protein n=1 Tax=Morganella morganii TaxID=582 RepID=UPI00311A6D37
MQLHQQKGDDKFITTDYLQQCPFLQVDPKAKTGKTIKYGAFNSTAFLTIDYF